MARTIVDIPDALLREVDSLCRLLGIKSRAEVVRRALAEYLTRHDAVNADGFGLWKQAAGSASASTPAQRRGK
jgi:metal-responsive CopG/Arc/MetJ family transcriptional regulator